jgi:medium-chain acyl-[acyl-carrier-protein] hydrolase
LKATHRQSFTVRSYETDPLGRLQVPILCKLLQEVAVAHASILGVAVEMMAERGTAWVLSRLQLTLGRWPRGNEEIVIETWPEAMNRLLVERRFAIFDVSGAQIGAVSTLWCVLDLGRRRPVRLPTEAWGRFKEYEMGSTPAKGDKLAVPEPVARELAFTVRRSDLDLAEHVNNTSYVEWAMEAVPDELWSAAELAELEIHFLAECHQGHTVRSRSQLVENGDGSEVRHQLVRDEDGVEVARARTLWPGRKG